MNLTFCLAHSNSIPVACWLLSLLWFVANFGGKIQCEAAASPLHGDAVDISTSLPCNGVTFPPANQRLCYNTVVDDPFLPSSCDATIIPRTNQTVQFIPENPPPADSSPRQTKIWSPGNLRRRNYQNNRLCRYNVACPPGYLLHYGWVDGNFILEDEDSKHGCLDYVLIENFDQDDTFVCGTRGQFSARRTVPLRVEFRSNTVGRQLGFQMDIICVRPEFQDLQGCRELSDHNQSKRKRRRVSTPPFVPQTGRSMRVPRVTSIEYRHNVVKIKYGGKALRIFKGIRKFIFWTGFMGTRVFIKSAPRNFIYGGGTLRLVQHLAFYSTVLIPPSFEPNDEELRMIGIFLNATRPFFVDQDVDDSIIFDEASTTSLRRIIRSTDIIRPETGYYDSGSQSEGSGMGPGSSNPRVDAEIMEMAEEWQDACNVFLRESALSYLLALQEMGIRT